MKRVCLSGICCLILMACGSDRTPVGEKKLGPSGGTIKSGDSTLEVPAGALDKETSLSLSQPGGATLPAGAVSGTLIEIGPAGVTFAKAVKLTIPYAAENLPQKDTTWLRMVELLPGGKIGATLMAAHDKTGLTMSAYVTKTGKYLLADLKMGSAVMKTTQKPIKDVDVLFVVDNSNSMQQEQMNLSKNFPKFIQKLDQTKLNYRIGVVSSDLGAGNYNLPSCETNGGDGGKLMSLPRVAGCTPPKDPWISKIDGVTNVPGNDVAGAFSCIAELGTGGCGFEYTLEAARRALDPKLNINKGFLRKDAALAVIFLTDEDDCSAQKTQLYDPNQMNLTDPLGPLTSFRCFEFGVQCDCAGATCDRFTVGPRTNCKPAFDWLYKIDEYAKFFKGLKPAGRVLLSAIAGPTDKVEVGKSGQNPVLNPSCSTSQGSAVPGIRIQSLTKAFGPRGHFNTGKSSSGATVPVSICSPDYSPALSHIGEMVTTQVLASWCLPYDPVDTNPLTSALDADCVVVGSKAGQLPMCKTGSTSPCYKVLPGKSCTSSKSLLQVDNIAPAALGDEVYAMCLVI